jgi:alpha-aminoadipic semialdehyde synthase
VLKRATITTSQGLVKKFKHLEPLIEKYGGKGSIRKNILLLGSGFVSAPLVEYLVRNPNYTITIASNDIQEANDLANQKSQCLTVQLDITDSEALSKLISHTDIVVSFVPAFMHVKVAEQCLQHGKNMVTASYISPGMKDLHSKAVKKGITIMNEIGLDPGIDHLTACQVFDDVKEKKGVITSFVSWCGGLPAPESSNNPLGYKFSWSPKGVLTAGLNSARFRRDGSLVEVDGRELLRNVVDVPIFKGYAFEGLANRDSIAYIDTYKLDSKQLKGMFRGTLRYKGYSELMYMFSKLGLLDTKPRNDLVGLSWVIWSFNALGKVDFKIDEWKVYQRHNNR